MSAIYRTLALCARNSEVFFLVAREVFEFKTTVKNSYFIAKRMNLTKTVSPFVRLSYIFSVKTPQITRF